jgi:hypothetical protein
MLKAASGFRAHLPSWDLATLLQMSCSRGDRSVVRVRSGDNEGFIYIGEGRLVHAVTGSVVGEPAVALMLSWDGGEFALCERPWPLKGTIEISTQAVLIRAAQARDESEVRQSDVALTRLHSRPPLATAFAAPPASQLGARTEPRASSAPVAATEEAPVEASVRIDMNGEIVAQQGESEALASLVGYVTRMGALLGSQLGLESFEALTADVGPRRVLVFVEGDEMVGLVMAPGPLHAEMRQQLGV